MPLPEWSVQGHNVTPKKVTCLENFPAYIRNTATNNYNELLNEFNQRNFYKLQGRPPYASVIRYALHLRHTSLQAYRLFSERFPMPYLSLLNKVEQIRINYIEEISIKKGAKKIKYYQISKKLL